MKCRIYNSVLEPIEEVKFQFMLSKQEPIAIYGGGYLGLKMARTLISDGYDVVVILDRNPAGVKHSPVCVMTAEDFYLMKRDAFVIIMLVNGVQHTNVAQKLHAIGFHKILFLPLYLRSSVAKKMVDIWNVFSEGHYDVIVPSYDMLWHVHSNDFALREDDAGFVIGVVHKDHVYTETKSESLLAIFTHFPEFDVMPDFYYDKNIDDPIIFDEVCGPFPFSDDLTSFLENAMFSPEEYFAGCAAPAALNDKKGYFNILDGHHRSLFLVKKGFKGIPLRIKKSEWELYFREEMAQKLMDYCRNLDSLPFEIKHPAFVRFPVREREADEEFVRLYEKLCLWN